MEFAKYIDVLLNGSQEEKARISFNLIDLDRKGWFTYEDFSSILKSILELSFEITGMFASKRQKREINLFSRRNERED